MSQSPSRFDVSSVNGVQGFCRCKKMYGWTALIDWLIDWWIDWLIDSLAAQWSKTGEKRTDGWTALIDWLTDWFIDWLVCKQPINVNLQKSAKMFCITAQSKKRTIKFLRCPQSLAITLWGIFGLIIKENRCERSSRFLLVPFTPSRVDFHCRVNLTCVNKIQAMNWKSLVHVKIEPRSTSTFTRGLSYVASISFTHVKMMRQWKSTYARKI